MILTWVRQWWQWRRRHIVGGDGDDIGAGASAGAGIHFFMTVTWKQCGNESRKDYNCRLVARVL